MLYIVPNETEKKDNEYRNVCSPSKYIQSNCVNITKMKNCILNPRKKTTW